MRIVIDARMYSQSGIGRYIRNLLDHLHDLDRSNEYLILLLEQDYGRLECRNNFKKIIADWRWYGVEEQIKLPGLLKVLRPDLVHFPHFNVPVFYRQKFVVTIHDLIHQHFPMSKATTLDPLIYQFKKIAYRWTFKTAVSGSLKILTPSNFVKDQLVKEWGVDKNKVMVTYEAVDDNIVKLAENTDQEKINRVLKKFNIRPLYLFYVGNAHPHKNLEILIQTFKQLKENFGSLGLVLAGRDDFFWQRIKKYADGLRVEDVIFTGLINDEELVALYRGASCLVMPSLEEGFGIPLLEAMACSCPVVSSKLGSLPEVGGDACLYIDPDNIEDIFDKISKVLSDKSLRKNLIQSGQKRYQKFSWKKMAQETLEVYQYASSPSP